MSFPSSDLFRAIEVVRLKLRKRLSLCTVDSRLDLADFFAGAAGVMRTAEDVSFRGPTPVAIRAAAATSIKQNLLHRCMGIIESSIRSLHWQIN
jgi:hypothetical protein